ncbi:unnamed protein product [Ilex paraguariensis]|uniref:Uncharacterized protein n=1 Tax=Ilex paraguariensis TaxID=185542 RepID=A0ABC8S268_9AQUA
MKRLEITSQRKRILGYANKSSKDVKCNPKKALAVDNSRNGTIACKDKSRAKDLLHPRNFKDQEVKSSRSMKSKSRRNVNKQCCRPTSKEVIENDNSGIKIDVKMRENEEHLIAEDSSGNFGSTSSSTQEEAILSSEPEVPPSTKSTQVGLSDALRCGMNSPSNNEERDLEINDFPNILALNGEGDDGNDRIAQEGSIKSSSKKEERPIDQPTEHQTSEGEDHEGETMDSDDKENALASDGYRDLNHKNQPYGRKIFGRQETHENRKKVTQTLDKNLKDGLPSAATGAFGIKYRKPKPTSPKPFRLRTQERGILKETNLERKIHFLAPQKESATVTRFKCENSHKRPDNGIQSNCNSDLLEGREKESEKNFQKSELKQSKTASICSRGQVRPKAATLTPQRRLKSTNQEPKCMITPPGYDKVCVSQKSENSSRKTESPSLQRQLVRQQGSTRKETSSCITPCQKLGVIRETSSKLSRANEAEKLGESETTTATKGTASASRSSSRGRRPVTIPKGPNFHGTHVPKSCIGKIV